MISELNSSCAEAFSERIAGFRHTETTPTRRSTRLASDNEDLPTPRETPSPRKRPGSSISTSSKRTKLDSGDTTTGTPCSPSTPKRKESSKYAPPSKYAHLSPIVDVIQPNLLVIFVGLNPGISTARVGHAYAHPSNRFWHLLHVSGLTPERKLSHTEDRDLPRLYRYGHTNIVSRPSKDQGELSKAEMEAGTADLEAKFRKWRPEAVCIAGKGIWEAIWKYKHGRTLKKDDFRWGWQDESENMGRSDTDEIDGTGQAWHGAKVFVTTSPSGQAASTPWEDKIRIWTELGDWVRSRRAELAGASTSNGA